jgi:hypothetical protein
MQLIRQKYKASTIMEKIKNLQAHLKIWMMINFLTNQKI